MSPHNEPFNPIITTTILCDIDEIGPGGDYIVGFFYNNSDGDSFIITAKHCLGSDTQEIYPRFRSASDSRGLSRDKIIPLWENGEPIWKEHPHADVAAIPLDIDIPDYADDIVFEEPWPHHYLEREYGDDAIVHHEILASAFTKENIPGWYHDTGDRLPFAGDEVSVITYDYTRDMQIAYEEGEIIKTDTLPKIRRLTISTPYRFDYRDMPRFLNEGRLFQGSSGCPVLYIPPAKVYSEEYGLRTNISKPLLIGVHGGIIKGVLNLEMLNLYYAVRAEEIYPVVNEFGMDWDTSPDINQPDS